MIKRFLLPNRAMPFEEPVNEMSGASLDEPHNLRQAH